MLDQLDPEKLLKEIPQLEKQSRAVSHGLHDFVLKGGKPVRRAADFLHGTWLGHPLHPLLTDVTIGAWLFSLVLDVFSLTSRSKGTAKAADTLLSIGNLSAAGTALAGLSDYSTIPRAAQASGAVHGLLNTLGLGINLLSAAARKKGDRETGFVLSTIASSLLLFTAWLGGEMVYRYKVGVSRIPDLPKPGKWHPTIKDHELAEETPRRVDAGGSPVLLYRTQGQIYAIGAVCAHEGAPLEEGDFDGYCVSCPWHQSVYDLRDGSVVHGPATFAEPAFDVRVVQDKIELRLREHRLASPVDQTQPEGS